MSFTIRLSEENAPKIHIPNTANRIEVTNIIEQYGCWVEADICAISISGHTELQALSQDEWQQFISLFGKMLNSMLKSHEQTHEFLH